MDGSTDKPKAIMLFHKKRNNGTSNKGQNLFEPSDLWLTGMLCF